MDEAWCSYNKKKREEELDEEYLVKISSMGNGGK